MEGCKKDVFMFLIELNTKHPSIKFECEISREKISFLYIKIYIKDNKFQTKIFKQKTDCHTYFNKILSTQKNEKAVSDIAS